MYRKALALAHKGFLVVEDWLNKVFSPKYNPMYYLGAISFLFTWMVFISGAYLLFFYSISVEHAYESLQDITIKQKWYSGIMRSIHRYASDGAMIALLIHLIREYFNDRYRSWRWVAWVTGVALIPTYWILGVTGYWMVWDQRAQVIARMSAEFMDFIPIFGEPLTRAFISNDAVSNILFIGVIFLHLAIPTILLFLLWMHVIRISRPVINPPKDLTIALTALTIIACIVYPATSVAPADLSVVAATFGIDWWYLALYPILIHIPIWVSWLFTVGGTGLLTFLPWFIKPEITGKAEVILPNCVGCELCFKDCPYEAILMRRRTDGLPYREEAVVVASRCASCGLCVGSCDFHAIDLADRTEEQIKQEMAALLASGIKGEPAILNIACGYGVDFNGLIDPDTRALKGMPNVKVMVLPCIAMLQPAMIEHALKSGAEGVFISGCQIKDCHFREGDGWLEKRLMNTRPPLLRKKDIDPSKIRVGWFSSIHIKEFFNDLRGFSDSIKGKNKEVKLSIHRYIKDRFPVSGVMLLIIPAVITLYLADAPYSFFHQNDSMLMFSIKHSGKRMSEQKPLTQEELKKLPVHLRYRSPKSTKRFPVYIEVEIDGKNVIASRYRPAGLKSEGASYVYEKVVVTPGVHKVSIRMSDINSLEHFDYTYEQNLEFKAGGQICIDFNEVMKNFYIRN